MLLLVVLWIVARVVAPRIFDPLDDPTRRIGAGNRAIVGALFWVLLGPLMWMVRR